MRLIFCLSALIITAAFSTMTLAAQPDIQSRVPLNHHQKAHSHPEKGNSNQSKSNSTQSRNIIISMNQNSGLNFLPGMADAIKVSQPALTGSSTKWGLQINKHHFTSEAENMKNSEDEKGPATLLNALWILGFGIFYILTIRKTRGNET